MRSQVRWFAERMENKLAANDHKGGWQGEPNYYFIFRIRDELTELQVALMQNETNAINECVDIANFAMMLADNLWQARARRLADNSAATEALNNG